MAPSLSADVADEPRRPPLMKPRRKSTIDSTILSPGAVRINFQGAFIVDEEPTTSSSSGDDSVQSHQNYATQGIRLPNHKAVVSHVALDVSASHSTPLPRESVRCCRRHGMLVQRELMMVAVNTDWRVAGQTGVFFAGAGLDAHGRPAELCQIRDAANQRMF